MSSNFLAILAKLAALGNFFTILYFFPLHLLGLCCNRSWGKGGASYQGPHLILLKTL